MSRWGGWRLRRTKPSRRTAPFMLIRAVGIGRLRAARGRFLVQAGDRRNARALLGTRIRVARSRPRGGSRAQEAHGSACERGLLSLLKERVHGSQPTRTVRRAK